MMNSVLIVTNFNAGRKKAVKYKKRVLSFVLKHTKTFKFTDLDELRQLDISSFDTILVMGGDGTVNKVLSHIVNSDKTLGIIPTGTANLLAARLGIPNDLNKALKIIENQNIKLTDCMKINENLSILRLGIGYDSDIICKTPQSLKNKFGYFAYFIAGILFGFRLKSREYSLKIDGEKYLVNASCIIVANCANMYKNIASVGIKSKPDDGLANIFVLKTVNPIIFFFEFLKIVFNIKINSKNAEFFEAKTITAENNWLNCHIDGEKRILKEDINISIVPNSIKIFVK